MIWPESWCGYGDGNKKTKMTQKYEKISKIAICSFFFVATTKMAIMRRIYKMTWKKTNMTNFCEILIFTIWDFFTFLLNMRISQKFVIFGFFQVILYIRLIVAILVVATKKSKITKKFEYMAILKIFSYFCVIFGFLLPSPYPHHNSGHILYNHP